MFIYNLNYWWSDVKLEVDEIKLKFLCEYMGNEFWFSYIVFIRLNCLMFVNLLLVKDFLIVILFVNVG